MSAEAPALPADLQTARDYIERMDEVDGWLSPASARTISLIHHIQSQMGLTGDLFEIGVHHGKSALLLSCFVDPEREWLGVNDLFDDQEENVSHSGAGDREIFESNLTRLRPGFRRYRIFQQPSQTLTLRQTGANCRLFHIDGGHSALETETDLRTAAAALQESGVIIVDDYFNQEFPAVSEGVNRFLLATPRLRPFLAGFNKIYICAESRRGLYVEQILANGTLGEFHLAASAKELYDGPLLLMRDTPEPGAVRLRLEASPRQLVLAPEEETAVEVKVENVGRETVNAASGWQVKLDHHLFRDGELLKWDNLRYGFSPLAPGESQRVRYPIRAPREMGRYRLVFDGVVENVAWISEMGGKTDAVELAVESNPAVRGEGTRVTPFVASNEAEARAARAEQALEEARRTEQELRRELERYARFHRALESSAAWRFIQLLRRLTGRPW